MNVLLRKGLLPLLLITKSKAVDYYASDGKETNLVVSEERSLENISEEQENSFGNFYTAESGGIDDEWIVVMKEQPTLAAADKIYTAQNLETFAFDIAKMTGSNNIKVMNTFTAVLQGFTVKGMTEEAARKFTKDKRVDFVEQNAKIEMHGTKNPRSWGLDRIDERSVPLDKCYAPMGNKDGSGVTAYILDTGIRISHREFKNASGNGSRARWGINTTGDGKDYDCHGHGTHVAGTVGGKTVGVAKNVNLVAVKVLDCSGNGSKSNSIEAMNWVMNDAKGKKATANLSFGGDTSFAQDRALKNLHNSGVLTVTSAGNDGKNACGFSPAREPTTITVGSTGQAAPLSCGFSCVSGNTGILTTKTANSGEKESITQVRDLEIGDTVRGFDSNMKRSSCKVEAIGSFGDGVVYGNYTSDHFVFNPSSGKIEEHGKVGPKDIVDKYDLISDCPLIEDESGKRFGPMDSDFCGASIQDLSWKDYLLLHQGILRVVRQSGPFWFQLSSYKDMETVRTFAPSVCKSMLKCMKDQKSCDHLEKASARFINNALTNVAKTKTLKTFAKIGSFNEMGSVSAVVTGGATIGADFASNSVQEDYDEEEIVEINGASEDKRSCFSNYGSCVDIFAPGANIRSADKKGDANLSYKQGTSMAAPHVCGAIALHLQNGASPSEIEDLIKSQATKNKVGDRGSGSPNLLLYIGGGTKCKGGSCISGNAGIFTKNKDSTKEKVTKVRDLQVGDTVRGYDFKMNPAICKVEAIGSFGTGNVYGNYTADHYVYNPKTKKVQEHGEVGTMKVTDKYDLISNCPLVEDESGKKFGAMDSDFCGGGIKKLSWKNYLLLHKAILNVVRETGSFWFSSSSYNDMETVAKFAPSVCKNMLRCIKNNKKCSKLERSSQRFIDMALTEAAKIKTLKSFTKIGSRCEKGSVSAIVTGGQSVDATLIGTSAC